MDKTQINISNFPVVLKEDINYLAEQEHRSFQAQIIHILQEYVKAHPLLKMRIFEREYNQALWKSKNQEN